MVLCFCRDYVGRGKVRRVHRDITEGDKVCRSFERGRIELLRSRVELLGGKDKVLLKMYLENGNTFRQMAQLAGVNEATIARRVYRLIQRLLDGEYITCLRNRSLFSAREMKVAKDYFLRGESMRKIAAKRGCSYYRVRQLLKKIKGVVEDT
jgi:DNA-directed RNA polymerase specialized sigma subunit